MRADDFKNNAHHNYSVDGHNDADEEGRRAAEEIGGEQVRVEIVKSVLMEMKVRISDGICLFASW